MDILKTLMGNKSILNGALGMLKNAFLQDGISAVIITPSDDPESPTPGMKIAQYGGPVAILAGEELKEVELYFRMKESFKGERMYFLPEVQYREFWEMKGEREMAESSDLRSVNMVHLKEPKEVDHV